jgi:hypothetical protein
MSFCILAMILNTWKVGRGCMTVIFAAIIFDNRIVFYCRMLSLVSKVYYNKISYGSVQKKKKAIIIV